MRSFVCFAFCSFAIGIGLAACSSDESNTTGSGASSSGPTSGSGASGGGASSTGAGGAAGSSGTAGGGGTAGAPGTGGAAGGTGEGGAGGGGQEGDTCNTDADCATGLVCICPNDACGDCGNLMGTCAENCMGG